MRHGPRGVGAYQQLHGLVLGALAVVVVVDIVSNGLARHVRVRGCATLRAVGLLGVAQGAGRQGSSGIYGRWTDGVLEARMVSGDGREAARRAGRRGRLEVGRARVGDDGVVCAALAAALAAPLGARAGVVGVLFAVLMANVDGVVVEVDGVVGGRRRRRGMLGVHGRYVRLARQAWASTTATLQGRIVGGCRRAVAHDIDEAESCPQKRQDRRLHGVYARSALGDLVLCERSIPSSGHFWAMGDTSGRHQSRARPLGTRCETSRTC